MKKVWMVFAGCLLAGAFEAHAQLGWRNVEIADILNIGDEVLIDFYPGGDMSMKVRRFLVKDPGIRNRILAIALTAVATDRTMLIFYDAGDPRFRVSNVSIRNNR